MLPRVPPPLPSPTLLTVAGSGDSPVFKVRRPECQKEGYPSSGRGGGRGARGAGGRDECNIGGGENNSAPRPVPPARPEPGVPTRLHRWKPGGGRQGWVGRRVPAGPQKAHSAGRAARWLFKYRAPLARCAGAVAMGTRVPATAMNGCGPPDARGVCGGNFGSRPPGLPPGAPTH